MEGKRCASVFALGKRNLKKSGKKAPTSKPVCKEKRGNKKTGPNLQKETRGEKKEGPKKKVTPEGKSEKQITLPAAEEEKGCPGKQLVVKPKKKRRWHLWGHGGGVIQWGGDSRADVKKPQTPGNRGDQTKKKPCIQFFSNREEKS